MSFRDDREAAHRRADALEQELKRTQAELDQMRAPKRPRAYGGMVVAGGVVALGLLGAVFWTTQRGATAEQRALLAREQAAREAEMQAARTAQVEAERARAAAEAEAERSRAVAAAEEAARVAMATAEAARVVWRGSVEHAVGVALTTGAPCTVEGAFSPGARNAVPRGLTIECGGQEIYRAGPEASAAASVSLRGGAVHGDAGHEYMLSYRDERATQPTRVTVSTLGHTATVWREGDDAMQVRIFVRDVSEAQAGARLGGRAAVREPSFAGVVERGGRVTAARGHAPVAAGERCVMLVRPVWEFPENCRVALRCGTTWLYGAREAGYLTCEVQGGRPVAALDENATNDGGDPRLNWRGRRVVVSDFTEAGEWSVDLAL
jgi:hypothetical protein